MLIGAEFVVRAHDLIWVHSSKGESQVGAGAGRTTGGPVADGRPDRAAMM